MKRCTQVLLVLILVYCSFSCVDQDVDLKTKELVTPELISSNRNFGLLIAQNRTIANAFAVYVDNLENAEQGVFLKKAESGEIELSGFYKELGFKTRIEFESLLAQRNNSVGLLLKEIPDLKKLSKTELTELFHSSLQLIDIKNLKSNGRFSQIQLGYCESTLDNCFGMANATLAAATTACLAALFTPIIGGALGPACEAAAITYHYYQTRQCNLDYQKCKGLAE